MSFKIAAIVLILLFFTIALILILFSAYFNKESETSSNSATKNHQEINLENSQLFENCGQVHSNIASTRLRRNEHSFSERFDTPWSEKNVFKIFV